MSVHRSVSADHWEFYNAMVAVQNLQEKHTDDVTTHYLRVAREALDAASARAEELERKGAA